MSRSKTNTPTPIGRRSFLQGTGLTALGLPELFAGSQSLQAAAPGRVSDLHGPKAGTRSAGKEMTGLRNVWRAYLTPLRLFGRFLLTLTVTGFLRFLLSFATQVGRLQ